MSPRKSQMNLLESIYPVGVHHPVLHEHESVGPVSGHLRMPQVVAVNCQTHPLVVVRQLAYVWQSFLRRLSERRLDPRIWIQSNPSDKGGWPPVGCHMSESLMR